MLIFEHIAEPWHALIYVAVALGLAWWAWRGYGPAAPGVAGWISRACRGLALMLLVLVAAGPARQDNTTTELPGRLVVAVDCSASMARVDAVAPQGGSRPRLALAGELVTALTTAAKAHGCTVDYRAIGGVDGSLDGAALVAGTVAASGAASPLADELDRVMETTRPDALVVVSDGRVTAGSALASLGGRWRDRPVPVLVLPCGGDAVEPELLIDEVVVNREVALGEREPVTVRLSTRALPAGRLSVRVTPQGGATTATSQELASGDATMRPVEATVETTFTKEGPAVLEVVVDGPNGMKRTTQVAVTVRERRLAVLVLENRPRFETRYLREAFRRDRTVTVHAYLADGRWRRWGTGQDAAVGPEQPPFTAAVLRDYDLIVLGDLGTDALHDDAQQAIVQAVRHEGAGLVWLPGSSGSVAGFAGTTLGALMPVDLPEAAAIVRGYQTAEPHRLERSPAAKQLGLLDPGEVPWRELPPLLGAFPITGVRPGGEVLVTDQGQRPLAVARAFGAGRSLVLAVDDTWRWRQVGGDAYLHRFHSQLFRYAASGRRLGRQEWRLVPSPRRAVAGEPVTISLLPNGAAPDRVPEAVSVRLSAGENSEQFVRLVREGSGFSARLSAPAPGMWTLGVAAGLDARQVDGDQLIVTAPTDELRDPRRDQAGLEAFARSVGGTVHAEVPALIAALPDLRRTQTITTVHGLWDNLWTLALIVTLLAADWAIRRRNQLP